MAVSKKTRFEVFKRDGFVCSYCGRTPPAVTLEVDHIIPVAEGGSDDPLNLTTACFDCNRGKSAGLLDDRAPVADIPTQTALILEREEQLREYHAAREAEVRRRESGFVACWNYWFELWATDSMQRWETPWEGPLRNAVEKLGVAEVKEAMGIAVNGRRTPHQAAKYLGGVLKRKIAQAEGRVVPCSICGESVVLDRGDDPTLNWYHVGCAEGAKNG